MRSFKEITDLKNKRVLLRADFDVVLESPKSKVESLKPEITEAFRIERQKPMIDWLIDRGAKIVIVAHLGREPENSFADLIPQLHMILNREIGFIKDLDQLGDFEKFGQVVLLDNIRKWPGEEENDEKFAQSLLEVSESNPRGIFDLYINNAFAVCHRKHASVSAITKLLPSYAGMLVEEEVTQLQKIIDAPVQGKVVIIGGAKAKTKVPVIKNFIGKAERILVGGVVLNDILKARGFDVKKSVVDENPEKLLTGLDLNHPKLVIPDDFIWSDNKILDIGENSREAFSRLIRDSSLVVWNGPVGLFEDQDYLAGTKAVAMAIVDSSALKIIGGGDTITAVDRIGLLNKFDFVSTGGGAMLAFLAGEDMPGLEVLGYV